MNKILNNVQYAGSRPVGNLHFDMEIRIDAMVTEKLYEDRKTLKPVPAKVCGSWILDYDKGQLEEQIRRQVEAQLQALLKLKAGALKTGGNVLIGFPSDLDVRS